VVVPLIGAVAAIALVGANTGHQSAAPTSSSSTTNDGMFSQEPAPEMRYAN